MEGPAQKCKASLVLDIEEEVGEDKHTASGHSMTACLVFINAGRICT